MSINAAKSILGGLLPFAANPVVLTVIGIGAATWAVASLFDDNEEETETNSTNNDSDRSERFDEPLERTVTKTQTTVREPLETVEVTDDPTVELTFEQATKNGGDPLSSLEAISNDDHLQYTNADTAPLDDDATKKELIRLAMSELGKRSGVARRQKTQRR